MPPQLRALGAATQLCRESRSFPRIRRGASRSLRRVQQSNRQQAFAVELADFEPHVAGPRPMEARDSLQRMRKLSGLVPAEEKAEMLKVILEQERRLNELDSGSPKRQRKLKPMQDRVPSKRRHVPGKVEEPGATCVLCSQPFQRSKDTPPQKVCTICEPSVSTSVRTVPGGLPTLGRRRR